MRIAEAVAQLDGLKPNIFNEAIKRQWLSEVDSFIVKLQSEYVLSVAEQAVVDDWDVYDLDTDGNTELLVGVPYTDVYFTYMSAKVDFLQSDIQRYNNSMVLYQKTYDMYAADFNRTHVPLTNTFTSFPAVEITTDWTDNI